jgi:trimeric autotransporter adhesin
MRKSYLICLLIALCTGSLWSQNVSVSGALVGNGLYPDLGSAFTAINGGAQTGATILVSILGNTTEATTATLNQGAWNYVYVSPAGGASRTISGNIAGALISMNGADRVVIDGLNTGGNALVIENSNNTAASTIQFQNDARACAVQKCTVRGANTSTTSGTIFLSLGGGSGGGNDSIAINQCNIDSSTAGKPINAILSIGTAVTGQENSQVTVSACNIANYFNATSISSGILAAAGNTDWTIQGNKFYQSATRIYTTANTHSMIQITSGNNHLITGNTLGFANAGGTGVYAMTSTVATRLIGINLSVGTLVTSSVQGNTVAGITLGTSSGATTTNGIIAGIYVFTGNVDIGTVTPNVIGSTSAINAIVATSTTTGGLIVGIGSGSTGVINISNNSIGGLSSSGILATVAGSITGINIAGAATALTVSGNTIGNSLADNMRGGTLGLTTGSALVAGINIPGAPLAVTVSNNNIRNLTSYGTGTTGFVRGIATAALVGNAATYNITGNTISDLKSNCTNISYASGLMGVQGIACGAGTNDNVSGNIIRNLANINTGTGAYVVVGIGHGSTTNSTIQRNVIYNLSNASTSVTATAPGVVGGIIIRSGTTSLTISNNMISLGNGQTTNTAFIGILGNHGSTPDPLCRIYHNTINIEGTVAAGAIATSCFNRGDLTATQRTAPVDIRNNIFTNTRTGGTGIHYAISNNLNATVTATGWGANASNYNVLNAAAANVGYWGANQTFANWQIASACDGASFSGIGVTYVNSATDLHLNMGVVPTFIESNGVAIAGITTDIDGQVRPGPTGSVNGGALGPDLGADEIDAVPLDAQAPSINYTALGFTCATGDRTLSATITDLTGVPLTGVFQPRIYFRKNAGAYSSTQGVLASGTTTNGNWTFTISATAMGGLVAGDVVSYYVIAQDLVTPTPYIGSNPASGLVATDVNTVTTPPTTPNSYPIAGFLTGTYTVGVAGTYPTLTAAVNAYNSSCLSGPVTFSLMDATYPSETFPIVVQANATASATNTLKIKPTQPSTVITGSAGTMLLNLNGADYVTVDGSVGNVVNSCCPLVAATRDLTFINTSTSASAAVIWLGTTASLDAVTNCTVQNCVIQGNSNTTTLLALGAGGATVGTGGVGNNNISFVNNAIRAAQLGIYSSGASGINKNLGLMINQNSLDAAAPNNLGFEGIFFAFTDNATVSCNSIDNIVNTGSSDVVGINAGFGVTAGFSNTLTGIADGVSNVTISNNKIGVVAQTGTFSAVGIGLGNSIAGTCNIVNNMVSGVNANPTVSDICAGIVVGGGNATVNVDHNTVSMQGTMGGATASSQVSVCFATTSGLAFPLNVRNNIFSNTMAGNAGATARFAAIAVRWASPYAPLLSNNNDLFSAGTGPGTYTVGVTGGLTGTNRLTLLDWQTETLQDLASVSVAPSFVTATDLHLTAANNTALNNVGMPLPAVTTDIDCGTRSATTPDLGADEFIPACFTATAGIVNPGDSTSCLADSLVLFASFYSTGVGSGYVWESSPFGANTWTATGGTNPDNFNTGLVTVPTDYRLVVTCATNSSTAYTDTLTFFVGDSTLPTAICQAQSVALDTTGQAVVGAGNYNNGSTDNCTAFAGLTFGVNQDTVTCGDVGTVNIVLTVTDAAGNSATCSTTLTVSPTVLTATISAPVLVNGQNVSCNGGSDGSATVTADGGCPTYTYAWSNTQTTATATGLAAGTYTVTVSDGSGQADTLTITITQPTVALSSTAAATGASCVPGNDGTASVNVLGGSPGYTYNWLPSGSSATITGLAPGSYSVTVTDIAGCTSTASATVFAATPPPAPVITLALSILDCNAPGMASYQWFLNGSPIPGGTGQTQPVTGAGTYTVTITDNNGCSATSIGFVVIGINAGNFDNALHVWPNPARGTAFVTLSGTDLTPCDLTITDLAGRVMLRTAHVDLSTKVEIDLRKFAAGTYLVETLQNGQRRTLRLVVE